MNGDIMTLNGELQYIGVIYFPYFGNIFPDIIATFPHPAVPLYCKFSTGLVLQEHNRDVELLERFMEANYGQFVSSPFPEYISGKKDACTIHSQNDIHYFHHKATKGESINYQIKHTTPFIQFTFITTGHIIYENNQLDRPVNTGSNEMNIIHFSSGTTKLYSQGCEPIELSIISLSPGLIMRFIPETHPLKAILNKSFFEGRTNTLSNFNMPTNAIIFRILQEIINCPLEKQYLNMYMRAKTIELLAIILDEYEQFYRNTKESKGNNTLKPIYVKKMYEAKHIIENNLEKPCSLIDLAHQVGTNDAYLKKHFKIVFGTTVFNYLNDLKMQEAQKLIQKGYNTKVIAHKLGYKHAQHFTRAFKKHFGRLPSSFT